MKAYKVLLGATVADAACMPTHWVYDHAKLYKDILKGNKSSPEFHVPPANAFYSSEQFPGHYSTGQPSPYGEQSMMLINYMAANGGRVDAEGFARALLSWAKGYTGRLDGATKGFLANCESILKDTPKGRLYPKCGADDFQANCFFKVPQIMVTYGAGDSYLEKVEEVVRAHQNNDGTVQFALAYARMLKVLVYEAGTVEDAIIFAKDNASPVVKQATEDGWGARVKVASCQPFSEDLIAYGADLGPKLYDMYEKPGTDHGGASSDFIKKVYAFTCSFPQSYQASLKIFGDTLETLGDKFKEDGFAFGIRRNIMFGGDSCGRSFLLGGLLVAAGAQVPVEWEKKTRNLAEVKLQGLTQGTM